MLFPNTQFCSFSCSFSCVHVPVLRLVNTIRSPYLTHMCTGTCLKALAWWQVWISIYPGTQQILVDWQNCPYFLQRSSPHVSTVFLLRLTSSWCYPLWSEGLHLSILMFFPVSCFFLLIILCFTILETNLTITGREFWGCLWPNLWQMSMSVLFKFKPGNSLFILAITTFVVFRSLDSCSLLQLN